ncbi:MAG: 4-hydroxy-tetrahydrodipicolinate synthase [Thermodesulfobacteriota bacterium]
MIKGSFTALITPFIEQEVDYEGLQQLTEFQIASGISGILAVGTTGESPTLSWEEHNRVIEHVAAACKTRCFCIAGTGSNNTSEALSAAKHAAKAGVDAVLMVDPYYNGPSSLEIRREYIEPVAREFPDLPIIPYVIPGRTGAQLLPEDLALLAAEYPNVRTVKEATGNLDNMKRTRACCGKNYTILSGDDALTYDMMTLADIQAEGVISVMSNIAPKAVAEMVALLRAGKTAEALRWKNALDPLFQLVTVKTTENTRFGEVVCRARNPLAVKTIMAAIGMPAGGCRRPLGKMTLAGLTKVFDTCRDVWAKTPEVFQPAAEFFQIDMAARLNDRKYWEGLYYKEY